MLWKRTGVPVSISKSKSPFRSLELPKFGASRACFSMGRTQALFPNFGSSNYFRKLQSLDRNGRIDFQKMLIPKFGNNAWIHHKQTPSRKGLELLEKL